MGLKITQEALRPRLLLLLIVVIPLYMATKNFYLSINSGIDDNIFSTSPSRLYVKTPIPGQPIGRNQLVNDDPYASIAVGDLLISINGVKVYSLFEAQRLLELGKDKEVDLTVLTPKSLVRVQTFRIQPKYLPIDWLFEIPDSVYVAYIEPGGASDRAGLKMGDLIYRINGRGFSNEVDADRLVRATIAGQKVDYEIFRNGKIKTLQVTMARVNIQFGLLFIQIFGLFWAIFGLFIALMRADLPAARLVGLGIFLVGVAFTLLNRATPSSYANFVSMRDLMSWPTLLLGFACFFHGTFYFPKERPDLLAKPWLRYAFYLIAICGSLNHLIFNNAFYALSWIGLMVLFHFVIRVAHWHNETREYKKLEMPLRIAGILTFLLILFRVFSSRKPQPLVGDLLDCVNAGLPFVAVAYTIVRYRLLGLVIRRHWQFSILRFFLILLLIVLFGASVHYFASHPLRVPNLRYSGVGIEISADPLPETERRILERIAIMLNSTLVGLLLLRAGSFSLGLMQRKFHRSPYDLNQVSQELIELMSSRQSKIELAQGIVTRLARLMFLKHVGILFFRDNHVVVKEEAFRSKSDRWIDDCNKHIDPLINTISRYKCEVCIEYVDAEIKEKLLRDGYKYAYPIYSREELVGCLLVGEKLSEATYRTDDFIFLAAIARQAGVAIENAFLYDRVAEQDRLRHELDIARRIQLSSLPQSDPDLKAFDVSGGSIPAFEVGGDYYGYFEDCETCFTAIVGDVSGKGTSAALHMSKLQGILGSVYCEELKPRELFVRVNPILYRFLDRQSFITAVCLRFYFDTRIALLARAGHLPLFHFQVAAGRVAMHTPKGMGLALENRGLLANILEEQRIPFESGDVFVLPSDGITEAQNEAKEAFGEDRLARELEGLAGKSAIEIKEALFRRVRDFVGEMPQHDDQTLVVIKIR